MYKYIIGIDPSGNFHEGKGTTGCCVFSATADAVLSTCSIHSTNYLCQEDYWKAIIEFIFKNYMKHPNSIVVIEDYLLYADKAKSQINSKMETPKLIGVLQYYCYQCDIPVVFQTASQVKTRWADNILQYKGYIKKHNRTFIIPKTGKPIDRHAKDAIRHAVHYNTFKNKEV